MSPDPCTSASSEGKTHIILSHIYPIVSPGSIPTNHNASFRSQENTTFPHILLIILKPSKFESYLAPSLPIPSTVKYLCPRMTCWSVPVFPHPEAGLFQRPGPRPRGRPGGEVLRRPPPSLPVGAGPETQGRHQAGSQADLHHVWRWRGRHWRQWGIRKWRWGWRIWKWRWQWRIWKWR